MGVLKDLGTATVADIDELTGYPRSGHGDLLNPISHRDGSVEKGWDKKGTELVNFTNPYGRLEYACGSGDDFVCFDFHGINAGPRGRFMILDATLNSETGSFIQGFDYLVEPTNTEEQKKDAVRAAFGLVDRALEWVYDNNIKIDRRGWNQHHLYFANSVLRALFDLEMKKYVRSKQDWVVWITDEDARKNTRRMQKAVSDILWPKPEEKGSK